MAGVRVTGTVAWFSDEKAYGFINPDDGGPQVFVHRADLRATLTVLTTDQRVSFELVPAKKGNGTKAASVELI